MFNDGQYGASDVCLRKDFGAGSKEEKKYNPGNFFHFFSEAYR